MIGQRKISELSGEAQREILQIKLFVPFVTDQQATSVCKQGCIVVVQTSDIVQVFLVPTSAAALTAIYYIMGCKTSPNF